MMMLIGQALNRFSDVTAQKQGPPVVTAEIPRVLHISSVKQSGVDLSKIILMEV